MGWTSPEDRMAGQRIAVCINGSSTRADADLDAGLALLEGAGWRVTCETFDDPGALEAAIRRAAAKADVVMVGGGDSTMALAAGVVAGTGVPLAVLPLGNACDFARSLGIPRDPVEACRTAAEGRRHAVDVGSVNGRTFLNMASLGLSVEIARRMTKEVKRRWGVLGYSRLLWDAARAACAFQVEIDCDGRRERRRVIQVGVGNGFHYGGGMTVAEDARVDDGLLHVHAIRPVPWWQLLLLFPYVSVGRFREPEPIVAMTGRRIVVATRRPRTVNADGEMTCRKPAVFEVRPRALEVLVPRDRTIPGLSA